MLLVLVNLSGEVAAQNLPARSPADERFRHVLDLVTVDGSRTKRGMFGDTIKLYDSEGNLWWEYSLDSNGTHPLPANLPKRVNLIFPDNFRFFKLTALSENWYQVEIDSVTGESKFMRIDDPFLRRDGIELRLKLSPYLCFDRATNPLRIEKAGATVDAEFADSKVKAVAIDGDWAQVEVLDEELKNNSIAPLFWVRWKKANKLLVSIGYR